MLTTYVNLPANPDTDLLDVEFADIELARFSVLPYTTLCISYADLGTAGGSWVADLQWSNNSVDWFAFATPVQIGPGAGPTYVTPVDVSDCAFVRLVVTTGEGASTLIRVAVCAKGSESVQYFTNLPLNNPDAIFVVETNLSKNQDVRFSSSRFSKFSATATAVDAAFSNRVILDLEWSNNAVDWISTGLQLLYTNTSLSGVDISTFAFLRLRCSLAEANNTLRLAVCMKSTS